MLNLTLVRVMLQGEGAIRGPGESGLLCALLRVSAVRSSNRKTDAAESRSWWQCSVTVGSAACPVEIHLSEGFVGGLWLRGRRGRCTREVETVLLVRFDMISRGCDPWL